MGDSGTSLSPCSKFVLNKHIQRIAPAQPAQVHDGNSRLRRITVPLLWYQLIAMNICVSISTSCVGS
ncbi:hypothetical protein RB213_009702, partial [Colletotrichum asianum]